MKRLIAMALMAALGAGAAFGLAACGGEKRGTLQIEGGTTGTGPARTGTTGTGPARTPTTESVGTDTAPRTTPTSP